jgi:hypothetical protein
MATSSTIIATNEYPIVNLSGTRVYEAQPEGILLVNYSYRYVKLERMDDYVRMVEDGSTSSPSKQLKLLIVHSQLLQHPSKHEDFIIENILKLNLNLNVSKVQSIVSLAQILAAENSGYVIAVTLEYPQVRGTCSICLEDFSKSLDCKLVWTKCSHLYHQPCILQWLRRKYNCPYCRSILDRTSMNILYPTYCIPLDKNSLSTFVSGHKFYLG